MANIDDPNKHIKSRDWIFWISINEIIGGIFGLAATCFLIGCLIYMQTSNSVQSTLSFSEKINLASPILFLIIYGLSIVAGWRLQNKDPRGLKLSIFIQMAQIIRISIPGAILYQFTSGFSLPLDFRFGFGGVSFNINAYFSQISFSILSSSEEMFLIGTNLIAILSLMHLLQRNNSISLTDSSEP